jgi:hypothetical protein
MSSKPLTLTPLRSMYYSLEPCAVCKGSACGCTACGGKGSVYVKLPSADSTHQQAESRTGTAVRLQREKPELQRL